MGKKRIPNKKPGNPMLNKIHAKEKRVFDQKLDIALQMGFDAAILAAHDVFQLGEGRFLKFSNAYKTRMNEISTLFAQDSADLEYSVERLDSALKAITGEKNHTPFEKRYF